MNGLLVDVGLRGHRNVLLGLFQQPSRSDIWKYLACDMPSFEDLGLALDSSDLVVWQTCQSRQFVLLTANRNERGMHSLERTIRTLNQADSLPVLTLASERRFTAEAEYKHRVADKVLEYLFEIDRFLGTGRLWVP
jgi:hypothetical protein